MLPAGVLNARLSRVTAKLSPRWSIPTSFQKRLKETSASRVLGQDGAEVVMTFGCVLFVSVNGRPSGAAEEFQRTLKQVRRVRSAHRAEGYSFAREYEPSFCASIVMESSKRLKRSGDSDVSENRVRHRHVYSVPIAFAWRAELIIVLLSYHDLQLQRFAQIRTKKLLVDMSRSTQANISSFFQTSPKAPARKKRASHIDLTVDSLSDDAQPPSKRLKATSSASHAVPSQQSSNVEAGPSLQKYGFASGDNQRDSTPKTPAQLARHEAFKKRLLLDNSTLLPNPSPENHFAVEFERSRDLESGDDSDPDSDESEGPNTQMTQIHDLYSNKGKKGTTRGAAASASTQKRPKKLSEVGPSGKTFTALELQAGAVSCDARSQC